MASIVFEVECEVEGRVIRGDESVGEFGPIIEDADLSSVSMLSPSFVERPDGRFKWSHRSIDLLEGLDATARNIVIANIMDAFGEEIDAAILQDSE